MFRPKRALGVTAVLVCTWCVATAGSDDDAYSKVMGSVRVAAGQHIGNATTVNGSIDVGDSSIVKKVDTVNGSITMHAHSVSESVQTVNGSVTLEESVRVANGVDLVNGHVSLEKGAEVGGHVTNVNGAISLESAHVGGRVETTTGDIEIMDSSHVDGGILVNENSNSWFHIFERDPKVTIGPGCVVNGKLRFRRDVKLYVSDRATIGTVEGATAIKFSGDRPPSE